MGDRPSDDHHREEAENEECSERKERPRISGYEEET